LEGSLAPYLAIAGTESVSGAVVRRLSYENLPSYERPRHLDECWAVGGDQDLAEQPSARVSEVTTKLRHHAAPARSAGSQ